MEHGNWPIILIEVVLIFGGVLAFSIWQLRSVRRDREAAARRKATESKAAKTVPD